MKLKDLYHTIRNFYGDLDDDEVCVRLVGPNGEHYTFPASCVRVSNECDITYIVANVPESKQQFALVPDSML